MSGAWDSHGAGKWGYWPGAFSPGAPWRKDKQKNKQKDKKDKGGEGEQKNKEPLFPAYDNKRGGVAKVQPSSGTDLIRVVPSSKEIVPDLQRGLSRREKGRRQSEQNPGRQSGENPHVARVGEANQVLLHDGQEETCSQLRRSGPRSCRGPESTGDCKKRSPQSRTKEFVGTVRQGLGPQLPRMDCSGVVERDCRTSGTSSALVCVLSVHEQMVDTIVVLEARRQVQ